METFDIDLKSGIKFPVNTISDKVVFNEIYINRIYEPALRAAIQYNKSTHTNILDLGCNVGMFSYFAADYILINGLQDFQIIGVDGSKTLLTQVWENILRQPTIRLESKIQLVHGLVGGFRDGSEGFAENETFSAMNKVSSSSEKVPYVDVDKMAPEGCTILKCDIEGEEERFLEAYPSLFRKSKISVFEFHPTVDTNHCRRMLHEYGYAQLHKEVQGNCTIETFVNWGVMG